MAVLVYGLCAATSALCAGLLLRAYAISRVRLLFWSALAFTGLAVSNALLFTDFVILPERDLSGIRAVVTCFSVSMLLFGVLWEEP